MKKTVFQQYIQHIEATSGIAWVNEYLVKGVLSPY